MKAGFPPPRQQNNTQGCIRKKPHVFRQFPVTGFLPTIYSPVPQGGAFATPAPRSPIPGAIPPSPLVLLSQTPSEEATSGPQAPGLDEALNLPTQFCPWMVYSQYSLVDAVITTGTAGSDGAEHPRPPAP